jgi:ubiquinone/menaquinone biosynthesis C-methylase UbiE
MSTDDAAIPDADETAAFYDIANQIIAELWDDNFHHGYWDSDDDQSSNREASDKLTDLLIERSGDLSAGKVLDVGCGIGLATFRLAEHSGFEITGVSNNQKQIDHANGLAAERGLADRVSFEHADALALPYADNTFDLVWVFETLPHLDRLGALREVNRVLKPGGRVVIADMFLNTQPSPEHLAMVREHEAMTAAAPMLLEHEYREVVKESGLLLGELKDVSANTYRTGLCVNKALNDRWDELVERYSEAIVPLLEAFNAPAGLLPEIGYLLAVARKAG